MNDIDLGRDAVQKFLSYSTQFGLVMSTDEVAAMLRPKSPDVFLDGFGLGVRTTLDGSELKLQAAMKGLAFKAQGRIPKESVWFQALSDAGQNYTFFEAASYTAVESGKIILEGAQEVGNAVIGTGKLLLFLLPIGVVAFIFVWGKNNSGRMM